MNTQNLRIQLDGFHGVVTTHKKDKRFGIAERLKSATWNVRGLGAKERVSCAHNVNSLKAASHR